MLQFCDIPMEDAGGKRVTPSQQRTSRRWRRRPESLLPPQFSQIDRDREHEVCHEQPLHDCHAEVFSLGFLHLLNHLARGTPQRLLNPLRYV